MRKRGWFTLTWSEDFRHRSFLPVASVLAGKHPQSATTSRRNCPSLLPVLIRTPSRSLDGLTAFVHSTAVSEKADIEEGIRGWKLIAWGRGRSRSPSVDVYLPAGSLSLVFLDRRLVGWWWIGKVTAKIPRVPVSRVREEGNRKRVV